MAVMIGAWGGIFRVRRPLHLDDPRENRSVVAMKILSELASALQQGGGFTITKPKRSKHEDVKAQCILSKRSGIDLYVSPQEIESDGSSVYQFGGFGFVGRNDDAAVEVNVCNAWADIQKISEKVVANSYSSQIIWLTEEQLDARAHQELSQR